jgi:hypothetical protein
MQGRHAVEQGLLQGLPVRLREQPAFVRCVDRDLGRG